MHTREEHCGLLYMHAREEHCLDQEEMKVLANKLHAERCMERFICDISWSTLRSSEELAGQIRRIIMSEATAVSIRPFLQITETGHRLMHLNITLPTTQRHDDVISSINRAKWMSPCSHRTRQLPPRCKLLNKDTAPCRNTLATQSIQVCDNHHQYSCLVGNTLLGSPRTSRLAKWEAVRYTGNDTSSTYSSYS